MWEQRYSIAAMCLNGDSKKPERERPLLPFPLQFSLETVASAVVGYNGTCLGKK